MAGSVLWSLLDEGFSSAEFAILTGKVVRTWPDVLRGWIPGGADRRQGAEGKSTKTSNGQSTYVIYCLA